LGFNRAMPRRKEVDTWFSKYENPMKDVVEKVREIVLAADARIDECIKWQAPTFTFEGNLASFFPKSKKHASLMFHQGAQIPGKHPLLQGTGGVSRMVKVGSVKEASAAKAQLAAIVRAWCDWKTGGAVAGTAKKPATKQKAAKKAAPAKSSTKKRPAKKAPGRKASPKKAAAKKKAPATRATPAHKPAKKRATKKR